MLLATAPVFAGTPVSSKAPIAPPPPAPCLFTWFAGGSVGYLTELEEAMYHLHVGTDTCWNAGGWDIALFAEIGYTERSESYQREGLQGNFPANGSTLSLSAMEGALSLAASAFGGTSGYDLEIIPITFNIKFERPIADRLGAYFGAGLGVARVSLDAFVTGVGPVPILNFSDNDWVFAAQAFAGLVYNVTDPFEVYGGVRYIYLNDASLSSNGITGKLDLDNEFLFELGARFNF